MDTQASSRSPSEAVESWAPVGARLTSGGPEWVRFVGMLLRGESLAGESAAKGSEPELALFALCAVESVSAEVEPAVLAELNRKLRVFGPELNPDVYVLGSLCAARLQRRLSQPHLALNALSRLSKLATIDWQPWLAWETLMAGGPRLPLASEAFSLGVATRMVAAASELLEAARSGDRGVFERSLSELRNTCPKWPALVQEVEALAALLDADSASADPEVAAWCAGLRASVPCGLRTAGASPSSSEDADATAFVLVGTEGTARRFLRAGLGLQQNVRNLAGPDEAGTGGTRTESGIAVLALAGPDGVSYADFVRSIYGASFVPKRHQGMLDVLVHRMRVRLAGVAEVRRMDSCRLVLQVNVAFVVPDGRTASDIQDRLLRVLGTFGGASAKQASHVLGIPRRTAHRLLQQLAATSSCQAQRMGGRVLYSLAAAVA